MTKQMNPSPQVTDLMKFLDSSQCNFRAVSVIESRLNEAGFRELKPNESWELKPEGKYYVTKNGSAIFAFVIGTGSTASGYKIISAHSDSPGFRIKPAPEMLCDGNILKLNTEVYGGPILYTWFDRPLSIAGRVIYRSTDPLRPSSMTLSFDRPLLTIPHLAIHYNRSVNDGNPLSKQKDMLPVIAKLNDIVRKDNFILNLVAQKSGIPVKDILDFDLFLYDVTPAMLVGVNNEFITSGRLDDLMMVHAGLTALLDSAKAPDKKTRILAVFDNEETGSGTKQGAASPVLHDIMSRINDIMGGNLEDFQCSIDNSFMISADNAHGIHPNYAEKQDPTSHPVLGGGPVIKINANCKYMTDAESAAVFRTICEDAKVPYQYFVNHSDVAGGSTLGNILTSQIGLRGVDMGAAQWAMHSVRETASAADHEYIIRAFTGFYNCQ